MTPCVVILDFDGTLVESVGIKDFAFETLFQEYREHLPAIMEYHRTHNATIRYDKFRYITQNILGQPYTEDKAAVLAKEFSQLVFSRIVAAPFVAGSKEFLEYFYTKIPLYLISMSPREEIGKIIEARDMKKYFKGIYTYPWEKDEDIEDILSRENVSLNRATYIGDTQEDLIAAQKAGIRFIGRDSGRPFNTPNNIIISKDFHAIKEYIMAFLAEDQKSLSYV